MFHFAMYSVTRVRLCLFSLTLQIGQDSSKIRKGVRLEKSKITMNVFLDVVFVVVVMMNHITHRYQRRWDLPGGRWPVFSGSISAVARSNRSRQQQSCPESWYSNVRTDNWGKLWNARDLEIGKVDVWRNQVDRYEDKTDLRVEGFSR